MGQCSVKPTLHCCCLRGNSQYATILYCTVHTVTYEKMKKRTPYIILVGMGMPYGRGFIFWTKLMVSCYTSCLLFSKDIFRGICIFVHSQTIMIANVMGADRELIPVKILWIILKVYCKAQNDLKPSLYRAFSWGCSCFHFIFHQKNPLKSPSAGWKCEGNGVQLLYMAVEGFS